MYEACVVCVSIHYAAEQCFRYGACMWCVSPFIMLQCFRYGVVCVSIHYGEHVLNSASGCVSPFIMLNSASGMVHV